MTEDGFNPNNNGSNGGSELVDNPPNTPPEPLNPLIPETEGETLDLQADRQIAQEAVIRIGNELLEEEQGPTLIKYYKFGVALHDLYGDDQANLDYQWIEEKVKRKKGSVKKIFRFAEKYNEDQVKDLDSLNEPRISWRVVANNLTIDPKVFIKTAKEATDAEGINNALLAARSKAPSNAGRKIDPADVFVNKYLERLDIKYRIRYGVDLDKETVIAYFDPKKTEV